MPLTVFPTPFRAVVIGASGAIGNAFVEALRSDPGCTEVIALHRHSTPAIDLLDEASIANAAAQIAASGNPVQLIIHAAGRLHRDTLQPEKKLGDINQANLLESFSVNAIGPALVLRYFAPLLDRNVGRLVFLSAKVGSIGDNHLGGWYSYRAAKAALNMLVKTASIELQRSKPQQCVVALHPGTVTSALSAPFGGAVKGRPAAQAAAEMLQVIDRLTPADSGQFISFEGEKLPW